MTEALFKVRLGHWERELASEIESHYGSSMRSRWELRCYESLPSTMDEARNLAPVISPVKPGMVLAEFQSSGRGRQGRVWEGAKGALFLSLIFPGSKSEVAAAGFPLAVGLAVSETLQEYGAKTGLKWPNDILSLMGRKVGGILVESFSSGELGYLVVGIGINLFDVPENLTGAIAVRNLISDEPSPNCVELAARLGPRVYASWDTFKRSGFAEFRAKWLERALYLGHEVQIEAEGSQLRGKFSTVDENGCLILDIGGGVSQKVVSGHFTGVRRSPF